MAPATSYRFRATIGRTWLLYTVDVPERISRAMKAEGKVAVVFTLEGSSPRKTTLTPRAAGGHRLHVHGETRREVGAQEGDTVCIVVSRDSGPPSALLPPDLEEALSEMDAVQTFRTMGPAMQRELVAYVEKAKHEATRRRHIARVVERACQEREKRMDREARGKRT